MNSTTPPQTRPSLPVGSVKVQEVSKEKSNVDMGTDPTNPPTEFSHDEWVRARDTLWDVGKRLRADDVMVRLYRAALAMNLCQEDYGHRLSTVAHHGGRLFVERAVHYLLGRAPASQSETLFERIDLLPGTGHAALVGDLHALRKYGNRGDHDDVPDIQPQVRAGRRMLSAGAIRVGGCGTHARGCRGLPRSRTAQPPPNSAARAIVTIAHASRG